MAGTEEGADRGPLSGYRVLDLTDDKGALGGKLFADMGADVIKVEPPQGCSTRRIPPFLDGRPGPDRSLYFLSYAAGKRSVSLDLESTDGQRLFRALARTADFVLDSFPLDHLDGLGIGYRTLAADNPRLIYCAITPYGDRGPGADWNASDLTVWAAGGMMFLTGQPDRAPLQLTLPQAGFHAGAEAAVACMIANAHRQQTGNGQRVVIDMQGCVAWCLMNEHGFPVLHGDYMRRNGGRTGSDRIARKMRYRCKDGYVAMTISGAPSHIHHVRELRAWMAEVTPLPEWFTEIDFSTWTVARFVNDESPEFHELMHRTEDFVEEFLQGFTKEEIQKIANERRMLVGPVATVADVAHNEQLAYRQFFRSVEHPALDRPLTFLGPFVRMSKTPLASVRRAPMLGEHNEEILCGELGVDRTELQQLYAAGIV